MSNDPTRRPSRVAGAEPTSALATGAGGPPLEGIAEPVRRGRLDDVRHVVILMQENRSFDHYFGTMRGVRGFGDRAALRLSTGHDVFHQPSKDRQDGGYLLPFRLDTIGCDGQRMTELPHDWETTHLAWNAGSYDRWVPAKTAMTMAYLSGEDIPFYRSLAQTFTICDHYFCSVQGPTTPNRLYHMSGTIDPDGRAGGPAVWNAPNYQPVYRWTTYPERLQRAGIPWRLYANGEVGDSPHDPERFVGDFGDNPLWLFEAFHQSLASADPAIHQLAERGGLADQWLPYSGKGHDIGHLIAEFAADCARGDLPAVSWVVAPNGYCEHPASRPVDGECYVQAVLNAIWANPSLWESTVVFLNYDENDGFFDHVAPPVAPPGTPGEYVARPAGPEPIGLGPRVPMTVVSPWSKGGWVNSQVFDHTSVLRFLEAWTGVAEPNISPWRRAVCGDLTSCFDFVSPCTTIPLLPDAMDPRRASEPLGKRTPLPGPPPLGAQRHPTQDPGSAPARPLPYQPLVNFELDSEGMQVRLANQGAAATQLAVHAGHQGGDILRLDIGPGERVTKHLPAGLLSPSYKVSLHGPNGFVACASGNVGGLHARSALVITADSRLALMLANPGSTRLSLSLTSRHEPPQVVDLEPGAVRWLSFDPIVEDAGWYHLTVSLDEDPSFVRHYAGHLENGRPSRTEPDGHDPSGPFGAP